MDFFFYGTLLDPDVRRLVLDTGAHAESLAPARIRGYRRTAVRHASYPMLVRRPGAVVDGLLARGLDRRQVARLCHYEGRNYHVAKRSVEILGGARVTALVFLGKRHMPLRRRPWRLDAWHHRHKRAYLKLVRRWVAAYRQAVYLSRGRVRWVQRWAAPD
jgi:hypothetical protein